MTPTLTRIGSALLLVLASSAQAVELADGKLNISGFGGVAYGRTLGGNAFQLAGEDAYTDPVPLFSLSITAKPVEDLTVSVQVAYDGGGVDLDWAFAEWRFSDALRFRAGRVKHALGIYGEIQDVGTLRSFYTLPESIYGANETAADGVDGAALSGQLNGSGEWPVTYDVYGGVLHLLSDGVVDRVLDPSRLIPGGQVSEVEEFNRGMIGGRIILGTPVDGLSLRLSAYATVNSASAGETAKAKGVVGVSAEYATERLLARGEYFFFDEFNEFAAHSAYLELGYHLTPRWEISGRVEGSQTLVAQGDASSELLKHLEGALGLSCWINRNFVVRASYHLIRGNRFAHPVALDDALLAGNLSPVTHAVIAGAQFSF